MNENNPATIKDKWNSDQDSITRYRYRYNSGDALFPSKEGLSVFINRLFGSIKDFLLIWIRQLNLKRRLKHFKEYGRNFIQSRRARFDKDRINITDVI